MTTTTMATGPGLLVETAEWLASMAGGAVPTLAGLRAGFAEVAARMCRVNDRQAATLADELVDLFTAHIAQMLGGHPVYYGSTLTTAWLAMASLTELRYELVAAAAWRQQQLATSELREVA